MLHIMYTTTTINLTKIKVYVFTLLEDIIFINLLVYLSNILIYTLHINFSCTSY